MGRVLLSSTAMSPSFVGRGVGGFPWIDVWVCVLNQGGFEGGPELGLLKTPRLPDFPIRRPSTPNSEFPTHKRSSQLQPSVQLLLPTVQTLDSGLRSPNSPTLPPTRTSNS